jgi:hypothetical protein
MKSSRRRRWIAALFLAWAFSILGGTGASGFTTERVVILVIDAPRDTEFLEEPNHTYIPHIWNELAPFGCVSHAFHNTGLTITYPGHATIVTGTTQTITEWPGERPTQPTIFEYYRHTTGAPASSALIVAYKDKILSLSYSDAEGYGPADSAYVIGPTWNDNHCVEQFIAYAAVHSPVVSMISIGYTDFCAHSGVWSNYVGAIRNADSLATEVWQWIESTPAWAGKTTLFITSDHGRHTTDWANHGDDCAGCRHIPLIALGPDFAGGRELFTQTADQRDIVATAATLLGIPAPMVEGRLMIELFIDPASLPPNSSAAIPALRLLAYPLPATRDTRIRLVTLPPIGGVAEAATVADSWLATLHDVGGRLIWSEPCSRRELLSGLVIPRPEIAPASGVGWLRLQPAGSRLVLGTRLFWLN